MKHSFGIFALTTALLGGCAFHQHPHGPRGANVLALHANPFITVRGDIISVGPNPLVFQKADGRDLKITWHLPDGFRFPDNGIVIEGPIGEPGKVPTQSTASARPAVGAGQDQIECEAKGGGRRFQCTNKNAVYGAFKYTIRVVRERDTKTLVSDPEIMNIE